MFVYGQSIHNTRLLKEARTLAYAHHDVRILVYTTDDAVGHDEREGFQALPVTLSSIHHRVYKLLIRPLPEHWQKFLDAQIARAAGRDAQHLRLADLAKFRRVREFVKWALRNNRIWHISVGWLLATIYVLMYLPLALLLRLLPIDLLAYVEYCYRSLRAVKQEPAQIYQATDVNTLAVAWIAKRLNGGKLVYDFDELWIDQNRPLNTSRFWGLVLARIKPFLIRNSHACITACESAGSEMMRLYRFAMPTVVRNATEYCTLERSCALRDELGISQDERIVLYLGSITSYSGLEGLIQSFQYLNSCSLVLMGYGSTDYISLLKRLVARKRMTEKVHFLCSAHSAQIRNYVASADLGVFPTKNNCFSHRYCTPMEIFEYIAAGLPVAGSNLPSFKKVIEEHELGVTFDSEHPRDIANAISYIFGDETKYEEMRKNALKAANIFSWDNESVKLLALYKVLTVRKND